MDDYSYTQEDLNSEYDYGRRSLWDSMWDDLIPKLPAHGGTCEADTDTSPRAYGVNYETLPCIRCQILQVLLSNKPSSW